MSKIALDGLLALCLVALFATAADAACRWEFDCSRGYPCRQVQVCDGALDTPTIRPPAISPIPPPTIAPIPPPTLPPIGTTQCRQAYLCDGFGRCRWETVCR